MMQDMTGMWGMGLIGLLVALVPLLIDARADGVDAEELGLPGKPESGTVSRSPLPAGGRQPSRAILFEDALADVKAGKRGGFGCVVGADRGHQSKLLRERGADIVIQSLQEVDAVQS